MAFVRKKYQSSGSSMSFEGIVVALGLDGEGTRIVVCLPMNEEYWSLDLICKREGRHVEIHFWGLPIASLLVLESKWSQGTVVSATSSDACGKELGMGKQVGGHEGTIGMSAHCNSLAVSNAHVHHLIDGCFCIGYELLNKEIVGFQFSFPYDRHFGLVHDRIATGYPIQWRAPAKAGKGVLGSSYLCCIGCGLVLSWIGPHEHRKSPITTRIISFGGVQDGGEVEAIFPRVGDQLLFNSFERRIRICKSRNLLGSNSLFGVDQPIVGTHVCTLFQGNQKGAFLIEYFCYSFVVRRLGAPQDFLLLGAGIEGG